MGSHHQISAQSAWLYRLITWGPARVSLTGETIHIERLPGDLLVEVPVDAISSITVHPSWFWNRLTIHLTDGTARSIGGLEEREALRIRDAALEEAARVHEAVVAGSPPVCQGPEPAPKPESTEGGRRVSVLKRQEGAPVNLG